MNSINRTDGERPYLSPDLVDHYRLEKFKGQGEPNRIDPLRNLIYDEVTGAAGAIDLQDHVFSINVPTGTGKTLTALSFALKLRAKIRESEDFTPRIIYCLPFLSIIDQNFAVFEDIFRVVEQRIPGSNILLKHHHLAEIAFRFPDDEVAPPDESLFLIEGWESEIVVTTFMQLLHTLISNKNRMLRKFNAMVNAIVILDEVQTIPYRYWHLVRMLFLCFANLFHTRFIFMTATQPLIFQGNEITDLVSPKTKAACLDALDRITFINRSRETLCLDEFKAILHKDIAAYPQDSFLIVMNTINCSLEVIKDICQYVRDQDLADAELYYLSTNIIPKHRLKRIRAIKKSSKRKLIVSTQLVEAGVDIDVDRVYRDFAPLDSLNQVAGRCNRNFTPGKKGVVTLFSLKNSHEFYKYIYGRGDLSISKTIDVLENRTELSEKEFLALGLDYLERLKESKSDDSSEKILALLSELSFWKVCEDSENRERFRLIDSEYPTRDLFIEFDEDAERVWRLYEDARRCADPIERKRQMNQIKKDLYSYVISVPVQKAPGKMAADWELVYINKEQVKSCYSEQTGFIREDPGISIF
jgi:CRISPR-associated endonuclease/helicase Cas3